jgi:hypothetical protein
MRLNRVLMIVPILGIVITGCDSIPVFRKSPADVVKATYKAANEGRYSEAEKYLSSDFLNSPWRGLGASSLKAQWDALTKNGSLETIEILKEDVRGEGARVHFRLHFKDGATQDSAEPLIQENGVWKITVG